MLTFTLELSQTESVGDAQRFKIRAPDGRVVSEGTLEAGLPAEPFSDHLIQGTAASLAAKEAQDAAGISPPAAPRHARFHTEWGQQS
jgi:hypothetical protein